MAGKRIALATMLTMSAFAASSAFAADYSPPPPPPPVYLPPPVVQEVGPSWYLRGDIGFTNQSVRNLTNVQDVNNIVRDIGEGFDSSGLYGIGVGYYFNDWMRFDVTGEYRSRANFKGTQVITSGGNTYTDEYSASKSEWLFLANAYADLGTWHGFTPFVGVGVGGARVTIHDFRDVCTTCVGGGVAFGETNSKWNFAWALHAGVAYRITKSLQFEASYRYLDLGDGESGDLYTYLGANAIVNPMVFKHLTSHDVRVGFRYNFDDGFDPLARPRPVYAPVAAPVYTQPAPVYQSQTYVQPAPVYQPPVYQPPTYVQPAPVYQPPVYQPPLRSRG